MLITNENIKRWVQQAKDQKIINSLYKELEVQTNTHNTKSYIKHEKNFFRGKGKGKR